jgi:hypothetical protein
MQQSPYLALQDGNCETGLGNDAFRGRGRLDGLGRGRRLGLGPHSTAGFLVLHDLFLADGILLEPARASLEFGVGAPFTFRRRGGFGIRGPIGFFFFFFLLLGIRLFVRRLILFGFVTVVLIRVFILHKKQRMTR